MACFDFSTDTVRRIRSIITCIITSCFVNETMTEAQRLQIVIRLHTLSVNLFKWEANGWVFTSSQCV